VIFHGFYVLPNMAKIGLYLICQIWQNKTVAATPKIRIYRSKAYNEWNRSLTEKDRRIVDARIDTFKKDGTLISFKQLDKKLSLFEFKWVSGIRVYFSLLQDKEGNFMLLLEGGSKNSQPRDIVNAKNLILKAIVGMQKKLQKKAGKK